MLVLSGALLLLVAGSVAAADEIVPVVDVPEDIPGADVIVFYGDSYTIDASGSTDNVAIVSYLIEFNDGAMPISHASVTGVYTYTFSSYGQTWVTVHAYDPSGNEGLGYFVIDVVEVVTGDFTFQDTSAYLTHSYYIADGDLSIDNSNVYMADGVGKLSGSSAAAVPDMLAESVVNDGDLAGHWEPFYYWNYGDTNNPYGSDPVFDTKNKLSGEGSIRIPRGSSYAYGGDYIFDEPTDLTMYNMLNFWFKCDSSTQPYYLYMYFWGTTARSTPYMYIYKYGIGYHASYYGWYGVSISLDIEKVHYSYIYGMSELSAIYGMSFQMYTTANNMWFDNVAFTYIEEDGFGDEITESVTPSGDFGGRWSSSYSSPSTSGRTFVGSNSVAFPMRSSYYHTLYYRFDKPTDLSSYDALRVFTFYDAYYYIYWYSPQFYVYTTSGYGYYNIYSQSYFNYYSYSNGHWDLASIPWGPNSGPTYNSGIDWTQVTEIRFTNLYTSSYSGTLYLDGMEWVATGDAGASIPFDNVPLAIYNKQGDTSITGNSVVEGVGGVGARIVTMDGKTTLQDSVFNNIWHTEFPGARNGLDAYGGIEGFGDAVVDHVSFRNCLGTGLTLFDGQYTLDPDSIDLLGTTIKAKKSPKIIFGVSKLTTGAYSLDIKGWKVTDSPKGTGILVMLWDTTASVDVTISGNDLDKNGYAGIAVSNWGGAASLDVVLEDQVIEDGGNGFVYYAGHGDNSANIDHLTVDNVTFSKNKENGLLIWLDKGATNLDATVMDSLFEQNGGNGFYFLNSGYFGEATVDLQNLTIVENEGNGVAIDHYMAPWMDDGDNMIHPVSKLDLTLNASIVKASDGWGIAESLNCIESPAGGMAPPWNWNGPTRNTLWYNETIMDTEILENNGGGWVVTSDEDVGWSHGNMVAYRHFITSTLDDNRGQALYIEPHHNLWGGGGRTLDTFDLEECRILDNTQGVVQNMGSDNFGYESEIYLTNVRIEGQDEEAILISGDTATDGTYTWGTSRVLSSMVYVEGCRMNSPVGFYMMGADDGGSPDWEAKMGVMLVDNFIDVQDEDVVFYLSAWPTCRNFRAWGEVGNNRFFRGFFEDGIYLEMLGGYNLEMDFTIRDQKYNSMAGTGVNIMAGTLSQSIDPHQVFGTVLIDNVTVTDAGINGINLTISHRQLIGSINRGFLEVHDAVISDVQRGISAFGSDGKVYDSSLTNVDLESVIVSFSVFDFYSCDVGPVTTENIKVLTKGAARFWFDLAVDVRWASGTRVLGAVVSVQDNTWSTIGVDTVDTDAVLPFGYVNSYTVLPDSVYSRTPYMVSATYLGLETDKSADVDRNMVVDLVLVDDVLPRLTVNSPRDGSAQRSTDLVVIGYAWDMHSGLASVEVSTDGTEWSAVEGAPDFTHTIKDVPEGRIMLSVRAIDFAGNERVEHISVMVDATPPVIVIIEPETDDIMTRDPTLRITGVTEMGAKVFVNNDALTFDQTLFTTTVTLKDGYNEVRVESRDALGNRAVHTIRAMLDIIPPPLMITAPLPDAVLGDEMVTVVGQTEQGARIMVDGVSVANIDGGFSARVTLLEGPNTIVVSATDAVGNMVTVRVPVSVDTLEPWLEMVSPVQGSVYGMAGIPVEGWVEAGSTVLVNDRELMAENGHFMGVVTGSEGMFSITVTVIDAADNDVSKTVTVLVDTSAPTIVLDAPADGTMTSSDTIDISGMLVWDDREVFRDVSLEMNGIFAPFSAAGIFKVKYELAEGTNPIIIKASDDVGNVATVTLTVVRDTKAPFLLAEVTPTFNHAVWNKPATYADLVYVEGSTEPGSSVTVAGAEVTVDDDGSFRISVLLDSIPEGEELVHKALEIVSTDAAGNSHSEVIDVYRLKQEETEEGFFDYESSQYTVLLLAILILVGAIIAAALLMRTMSRSARERDLAEEYDDIGGR